MCLRTYLHGEEAVEMIDALNEREGGCWTARVTPSMQEMFRNSSKYHIADHDIVCYKVLTHRPDKPYLSPYQGEEYTLGELKESDIPIRIDTIQQTDKKEVRLKIYHGLHAFEDCNDAVKTHIEGKVDMVRRAFKDIDTSDAKSDIYEIHKGKTMELHKAIIPKGTRYVEGAYSFTFNSICAEKMIVTDEVVYSVEYNLPNPDEVCA